jgi:hypothetical protein
MCMAPGYELYLLITVVLSALTLTATAATALIILRQAELLRVQNQVQALVKLNELWNSRAMLKLRNNWTTNETDLQAAESVLEFLEEFAALKQRGIFTDHLAWDSVLGWYAARYYAYNQWNGTIEKIRSEWSDPTLYKNLNQLFRDYIKVESQELRESEEILESNWRSQKKSFLEDEKKRHAVSFPSSAD